MELGVDISHIIDIGAGTGTLLKTAMEFGSQGIGYEVNPLTQPYAREVNGVDVRSEFWSKQTNCGNFTLLTCVMVMEHIPQPRALIRDMVEACIANGAALFISVPFFFGIQWHFINDPDPGTRGTQFFDQDVHMMHFSPQGMENLLREFGMTSIVWVRKGIWHGPVARKN